MTAITDNQRSSRIEWDHLACLTEAASSLTVDPVKSIFYYLVPFMGAWVCSHQELRLNDPLQSTLLSEGAKKSAIAQVERLKEIAGISRQITVYTSDNYTCSSYGGTLSLTSPVISIPRGFLTKPSETIFEDVPTNGLANQRAAHLAVTREVNERGLPQGPEPTVVNSGTTEEPAAHWKFTADETLFFIAKEIANIKANIPLIRIATKVLFVAALFFIFALSLPLIAGAALMGAALALHLISERLMKSHLDIDAVVLLKEFFRGDEDRANAAGITAIQKLIEQNKERREGNSLCQMYITEKGNNFLDLTNPFLTVRLDRLEEHAGTPTVPNEDQ